jgi:hypothetical protein
MMASTSLDTLPASSHAVRMVVTCQIHWFVFHDSTADLLVMAGAFVPKHTIQLAHYLFEVVLQAIVCCDEHIQAVFLDHLEVFRWIDVSLEQDAARHVTH